MKFNTADEAFAYIGSFMNFEKSRKQTIRDYRLDRMHKLLDYFDNPHKDINLVHIAGSKGKGSTGIMLSNGIKSLGYRTGFYTSPHISTYKERITLAGEFFSESEYTKAAGQIAERLSLFQNDDVTGSMEPTTFELLTLMAFIIFRNTSCTWAVIETGIGGRLDATNVISPKAVVITPIETEHTDILGETVDKIAMEKAGIIKKDIPVFSSAQPPEVERIILRKAKEENAPVINVDKVFQNIFSIQNKEKNNTTLEKISGEKITFSLKMSGEIQSQNAALAWMCLETLFAKEIPNFKDKTANGFSVASLPGRFEITGKNPSFIFDGAHTPNSIKQMCDTYKKMFGTGGILIFGSVEGKDHESMAGILTTMFDRIIISTPGTFKESSPEKVYNTFKSMREETIFEKEPGKALSRALDLIKMKESEGPILTCGSFYMAAEIRNLVVKEII